MGGTSSSVLYRGTPSESSTIFRLEMYRRVRFSRFRVYIRVGKTAMEIFKRAFKLTRTESKKSQFIYAFKVVFEVES